MIELIFVHYIRCRMQIGLTQCSECGLM